MTVTVREPSEAGGAARWAVAIVHLRVGCVELSGQAERKMKWKWVRPRERERVVTATLSSSTTTVVPSRLDVSLERSLSQ